MKKLVSALIIIAFAVGIGVWLSFSLRAKQKYDAVRSELGKHLFSVIKMDADTSVLLADVRADWVESHSQIDGPSSDAIRTVGLTPSVSNLVEVFTYEMPTFSLLSLGRNKKPVVMGMLQSMILPVSIDASIHLSNDGHLALIRCRTNVVYVFSDEETGLRESMYYVKKVNIEPNAAPLSSEGAPSEGR
jgi:hypothetical protein